MGSHIVAKEKIKSLTSKLEKSLYKLKYGDKEFNVLDESLYCRINSICENKYPFPLVKICDQIYLDGNSPQLYCTLAKLAEDYNIILNYEKVHI